MNGSTRTIDARGLPCPQPVVLTKKALEEGGFAVLEVLVGDEAARDNVVRFSTFFGCEAEAFPAEEGGARILIRSAAQAASEPEARREADRGADAGGKVAVLLSSDTIGRGGDELGSLLMRGFVYALAEGADKPGRIILMNAGVKLAVAGSDSIANLKRLSEAGVDVVACGTCVAFFGLKEKLGAGRISNMYEIAEILVRERVVCPC